MLLHYKMELMSARTIIALLSPSTDNFNMWNEQNLHLNLLGRPAVGAKKLGHDRS